MINQDASNPEKPLVLLVDDEPGLVQLFSGLLARLPCTFSTALGGAEAIAILNERTPSLLILDLAMPNVSGFDVLRRVREIPRLADMTVMILTARPNMVPEIEALGIDFWVSKPILPRDFLGIVGSVLNEIRGGV